MEARKLRGKIYDRNQEHSVGVGVFCETLEDKCCKYLIIQPEPLPWWDSPSVEELQNTPHEIPATINSETHHK